MKRLQLYSIAEKAIIFRAVMCALCLAVLDQITKDVVVAKIPFQHRVTVIPGFFDLTYIENPGAAWGMFANQGLFLLTVSLIIGTLLIVFLRKLCSGWTERYFAVFLIVSGILGNSYDRIFRGTDGGFCDGRVVDFLSFHINDVPWAVWPSFNVADSCICIGAAVFVLSNFLRPDDDRRKGHSRNSPETKGSDGGQKR